MPFGLPSACGYPTIPRLLTIRLQLAILTTKIPEYTSFEEFRLGEACKAAMGQKEPSTEKIAREFGMSRTTPKDATKRLNRLLNHRSRYGRAFRRTRRKP